MVLGLAVVGEQDHVAQHVQNEDVGNYRRLSDDVRQCSRLAQQHVRLSRALFFMMFIGYSIFFKIPQLPITSRGGT